MTENETQQLECEIDFYPNLQIPHPPHGTSGKHRQFIGKWNTDNLTYSGDRLGSDIYCANCNHWNTVKNTNILFSIVGNCKKCGTSFYKEKQK